MIPCIVPHGCIIEYLLKDGRAQPCNEDLIHAAKNGYYSAVEALMKDPRINPSIQDNRALKLVRTNLRRHGSVGEPWCISWEKTALQLLTDPRVDPSVDSILLEAVINNIPSIVSAILKDLRVDPSANGNRAVTLVGLINSKTDEQNAHMFRILLSDARVNPSADRHAALYKMAVRGHCESIQTLLKDPRLIVSADEGGKILAGAAGKGNVNVVRMLLEDGRFPPTVQAVYDAKRGGHTEVLEVFSAHRKNKQ
ncbi:hypothetical protein BCR33DRAFT_734214 [Rhizoclosmatium globosum]|uniref:Ankyrin n=1 Tax=Rhizoclosmatium globosum TaxID=329046 RepID=A0A1Y2CVN3_9FUNG|nr:hypothetical protein BCR33DRAFT_734214 [Rhizoclosmatium globosum]|eukprot:ORY51100.1 hypothetical protein BCR33DRAFT_734214 [Rhizoclosmatium globosum]